MCFYVLIIKTVLTETKLKNSYHALLLKTKSIFIFQMHIAAFELFDWNIFHYNQAIKMILMYVQIHTPHKKVC